MKAIDQYHDMLQMMYWMLTVITHSKRILMYHVFVITVHIPNIQHKHITIDHIELSVRGILNDEITCFKTRFSIVKVLWRNDTDEMSKQCYERELGDKY